MKKHVTFRKVFWTSVYAGVMVLAVWHYREMGVLITLVTLPPVIDRW